MAGSKIRAKERDVVIQALRAGVVPSIGLHHIQVGRAREIKEMARDVERIAGGGSTVRFVIGDYGSGKTFFLNLTRHIALEKGLIAVSADLAPQRRLHGTKGQARSLYAELMHNLSTRTKQAGGALSSVVERFITNARKEADSQKVSVEEVIQEQLHELQELVSGHDFAMVIQRYWEAFQDGDKEKKAAALRWLRGEFSLKTEAREALGVRSIINDAEIYDYLKLMGKFATLAGYRGLVVFLDEMVNLFKLSHSQSRSANYEQILRIVNDVLQGHVGNFGVLFGGTPEFLMDSRRGLYSYEALRSRLAQNTFAQDDLVDLSGPVLKLQSLAPEEIMVLLVRLRHLFAGGKEGAYLVPDEALDAFMQHCSRKIGDAYFRTPRNTIKGFLDLLAVLDQNPGTKWEELLDNVEIEEDKPEPIEEISDTLTGDGSDDELTEFQL